MPNVSVEELVSRLRDWETLEKQGKVGSGGHDGTISNVAKNKMNKKNYLRNLTRYQCGKRGQYRRICPELLKTGGSRDGATNNVSAIDERIVEINNLSYPAFFDTGATYSMLGRFVLSKINRVRIEKLKEKKRFSLINGSHFTVSNVVYLSVKYQGRRCEEQFYIIEDEGCEKLLLGNNLVRTLCREPQENIEEFKIPIECTISMVEGKIVNWTRPIRSRVELREFAELIDDFERKGIVESRKSLWLNPVVLRRKKDNTLRFCVDLRNVNDLMGLDGYT